MRRLAYVVVMAVGLGLGIFWFASLPLVWVDVVYSQPCNMGYAPWTYHQAKKESNPYDPFEQTAYLTKIFNPLLYDTQKYFEDHGIFLYYAVVSDVDGTCEGCSCPGYIYSFLVAESDASAVGGLTAEIKCSGYDTCYPSSTQTVKNP